MIRLTLLLAMVFLASACTSPVAPTSPNVDATVQAAVQATMAVVPTATALPTPTTEPTQTPQPTATPRPTPVPTPEAAIPPRGAYKHGYTVEENYDKIDDVTDVTLKAELAEERRAPGSLMALYSYNGTSPAKPTSVFFAFVSSSDTWRYLQCHNLSMLLDGESRLSPETKHDGDVGRGYVLEFVQAKLPASQFLLIVNAKKVEGRVCNSQFTLTSAQMEALRDMASRMQP